MKKIIIVACLCLGVILPSIAQRAQKTQEEVNPLVNKRGIPLLPQAGDYAIGVDATPFLEYLGNFFNFNGEDNFNPAPYFGDKLHLYGKYFLQDNRAVRAKLQLNFGQDKYKNTVQDNEAIAVDPTNLAATTVDVMKVATNGMQLNVGYEFRRGRGRLQGFYGGEFLIGFETKKTTFDYGNPITAANQEPTTWDFGGDDVWNTRPFQGYRLTEYKEGTSFNFGLGAFAGVEYFFAPQMAIGGEVGLAFDYKILGQNELVAEGFLDSSVQKYKSRERFDIENAFTGRFGTQTTGKIFLMFYF